MSRCIMEIEGEWGNEGWIEDLGDKGEYLYWKWFKLKLFVSWFFRVFIYFKSCTDFEIDQTFLSRQRTCNRSMEE